MNYKAILGWTVVGLVIPSLGFMLKLSDTVFLILVLAGLVIGAWGASRAQKNNLWLAGMITSLPLLGFVLLVNGVVYRHFGVNEVLTALVILGAALTGAGLGVLRKNG